MNWMNEFDSETLKIGYKLFIGKYIRKNTKTPNGYEISIGGSWKNETVRITCLKDNAYSASCSCFDSAYGKRKCSHMAAAMFSVVGGYESQLAPGKIIHPFRAAQDDDFHYFSMDNMVKNLAIDENQYNAARKIIADGRVINSKFQLSSRMNTEKNVEQKVINGTVEITTDSGYDAKINLEFGRDKMYDAECSVPGCYHRFNGIFRENGDIPCRHILAAMLAMEDYIKLNNPGDATDKKAVSLLNRFRARSSGGENGIKQEIVCLEPELQNDDGELSVGFKIGVGEAAPKNRIASDEAATKNRIALGEAADVLTGKRGRKPSSANKAGAVKLLKVKNLTELVDIVSEGTTLSIGKTLNINFSLCKFDENSQRFFDFIKNRVKDNEERNRRMQARIRWGYYYSVPTEKIASTIPLEGSAVDEIFELCSSMDSILYVEKRMGAIALKGNITCSEAAPKMKLNLSVLREGNAKTGVTLSGFIPNFCNGASSAYFADQNHLYRIPEEIYQKLQPIIELAGDDGSVMLHFGRRNLGEFYYSVLPTLSEVIDINDSTVGVIDNILPPKLEIVYYLDSLDGMPVCQVKANYGDNLRFATDALGCSAFSESYRNYNKEKEAADLAQKFFSHFDATENELSCADEDEAYIVYKNGIDELLKLGEIQCTDRFQGKKLKSVSLKVGVSLESDLLNLDIASKDVTQDELADILASYRLKKKYHKLKNGDLIDLEDDNLTTVMNLLDTCNASPKDIIGDKIKLPVYRSLYLDKLLENNEELYSHRDRNFRKIVKDFATIKDSEIEVPESLEDTLRNYQVYGYKWIRTLGENGFGGILADEMGLGKTLQVITALLAATAAGSNLTSLIVCPASLVYNWKEEFSRFAPSLKVVTVAGGARERHSQIKNYRDADVLVTSYDLLKRDIAEYDEPQFAYCVIDEAQYVKNQNTAAAKTVKVIKAAHRLALTGTPIENRLSELWSIFDFLMPGFLFGYETFRKNFETPIAKFKDDAASDKLKKLVGPFILRRLKTDVLKDLPDKIEEVHYAVMEDEQQKIYDAEVSKISTKLKDESEEEFKSSKIEILAELTKIRQICCDPHLTFENYTGASAKTDAAVELIESAIEGEHRMLVFSQFTSMLEVLEKRLSEKEIPYYKLTGATSKEERIRLMKQFNEGEVPVFLISLKAGGTGLNLTGADVVIHYDPWWNVAVQNQATDRAHRIGQTKNVTVYKLIIKGSIEEKIVKLQEAKKNLADEILSGENGNIGSLTREDLLELLGV